MPERSEADFCDGCGGLLYYDPEESGCCCYGKPESVEDVFDPRMTDTNLLLTDDNME